MKARVLYFARLRERFECGEETVEFDGSTVGALVAALVARGGVWADELAEGRAFRIAVNQDLATPDTVVTDHAEVAIFPPVTGG